jgi:hypothetical protein
MKLDPLLLFAIVIWHKRGIGEMLLLPIYFLSLQIAILHSSCFYETCEDA